MTTDPDNATTPDDSSDAATGAADRAAEAAQPTTDPVNRWATEHYGFADDSFVAAAPVTSGAATKGLAPRPPRKRALLAAGVLGMILTGAIGGTAIAASGGDGGPGRDRDDVVQIQRDVDGDPGGAFDGGRDGGFR